MAANSNKSNLESQAGKPSSMGDAIAVQAQKFSGQHPHDVADPFAYVHDALKGLNPLDRQAIFASMTPAPGDTPSKLPDLKLTSHPDAPAPFVLGHPSADLGAKLNEKFSTKTEEGSKALPEGNKPGKQDKKPENVASAHEPKSADHHSSSGGGHAHLNKGGHHEVAKVHGAVKAGAVSTNYILRERDESHPGQIVERTYDRDGKLIPDAPVKVISESSTT